MGWKETAGAHARQRPPTRPSPAQLRRLHLGPPDALALTANGLSWLFRGRPVRTHAMLAGVPFLSGATVWHNPRRRCSWKGLISGLGRRQDGTSGRPADPIAIRGRCRSCGAGLDVGMQPGTTRQRRRCAASVASAIRRTARLSGRTKPLRRPKTHRPSTKQRRRSTACLPSFPPGANMDVRELSARRRLGWHIPLGTLIHAGNSGRYQRLTTRHDPRQRSRLTTALSPQHLAALWDAMTASELRTSLLSPWRAARCRAENGGSVAR